MAAEDHASSPNFPELTITRVFDAPRDLVFEAWTDAKHLAKWWGPHHFTNPVCELDVRVGGAIRIDMRAETVGHEGMEFCGVESLGREDHEQHQRRQLDADEKQIDRRALTRADDQKQRHRRGYDDGRHIQKAA